MPVPSNQISNNTQQLNHIKPHSGAKALTSLPVTVSSLLHLLTDQSTGSPYGPLADGHQPPRPSGEQSTRVDTLSQCILPISFSQLVQRCGSHQGKQAATTQSDAAPLHAASGKHTQRHRTTGAHARVWREGRYLGGVGWPLRASGHRRRRPRLGFLTAGKRGSGVSNPSIIEANSNAGVYTDVESNLRLARRRAAANEEGQGQADAPSPGPPGAGWEASRSRGPRRACRRAGSRPAT